MSEKEEKKEDVFQKLGGKLAGVFKRVERKIKEEGGVEAAAEKFGAKAKKTALGAAETAVGVATSKPARIVAKLAVDKVTGLAGAVVEYGAKGLEKASDHVDLTNVPEGGAEKGAKIGALLGGLVEKGYEAVTAKVRGTVKQLHSEAREATLQDRHPELREIAALYVEFDNACEMEMEIIRKGIVYKVTKKRSQIIENQPTVKRWKRVEVPVVKGEKALTEILAETPLGKSKATFEIDSVKLPELVLTEYESMVQAVFDYCSAGLKEDIKSFKRKDTFRGASGGMYTVELVKDKETFSVSFKPSEGRDYSVGLEFSLTFPKESTLEPEQKA